MQAPIHVVRSGSSSRLTPLFPGTVAWPVQSRRLVVDQLRIPDQIDR